MLQSVLQDQIKMKYKKIVWQYILRGLNEKFWDNKVKDIPVFLKDLGHDRLGELIGATRVTTTRLLSKWRQAELVEMSASDINMSLAPSLINSSPLTF